MKKPTILTGGLVGLLLTASLVVLFFLGDAAAGLPLVPFDVFDWAARTLPGPVITFGIDLMVGTLIALKLDVANLAKTAEHIMAVAGQLASGAVAGAAFFGALRRAGRVSGSRLGLALGALVGLPVLLVSLSVNRTAMTSGLVSGLWIVAAHLAWGAVVGWTYDNLSARPPRTARVEVGTRTVSVEPIGRREFLIRMGAATAAFTVVGAGLGAMLSVPREEEVVAGGAGPVLSGDAAELLAELPNADDPLEAAPGTRPEYTPLEDHYRIDISSRPPVVDGESWRLPITGLVKKPLELTLDDLQNNYEPQHQFVTLSCISNRVGGNLISTTLWTGASLQDVLADADLKPGATHLAITSADGFYETLALDLVDADRRVMLAYHWDGQPLQQKHGFPLRVYIPDRYGMKQPKWITGIEVFDESTAVGGQHAREVGYWVERGWDREAIVRATAVIDTVAINSTFGDDPGMVPIGGIAYAGARGISKVEVKVDDGPWTETQTRAPLSETTWLIWRYDWPFEKGQHTFYVRCTDGDGQLQIAEERTPHPSGATGVHSVDMLI